jgi:hypothetical protein
VSLVLKRPAFRHMQFDGADTDKHFSIENRIVASCALRVTG